MANAYTCNQIQETENSININKHGACMNKRHVEHSFVNRYSHLFIFLFLYFIMYWKYASQYLIYEFMFYVLLHIFHCVCKLF